MKKLFTLATLSLSLFPFTSQAQCMLDQNQPQWNGGTSERNLPGYYDWESFTAGTTGVLCNVDVMFCNSNTQLNGTGIMKIFDGTGISGTLLASDTFTVNGTAYNLNTPFWQSFYISAFPPVVAGQVYTWEFIPIQGGGLPDPYLIQVNIPDVYAGGISYGFGTGGDITFRTYADISLGVNAPVKKNDLDIYPNPVANEMYVSSGISLTGENYSVYDETGRVVLQGKIDEENPAINVRELASGIYFLKVGEMEVEKIVKE